MPLSETGSKQYSTFRVGTLLLGMEVVMVQEVLRFQEMTVVPLAQDAIAGLLNLRGQIVIALDMRRILGLSPRAPGVAPMHIVVQSEDGCVSLLVDDIGDVVELARSLYGSPPDNLPPDQKELIDGVYSVPGELLLIVNTKHILQKAGTSHSQ